MISRIWRAEATPEGAERYSKHFEDTVVPELRGMAGFVKADLLTRQHYDEVSIEVHTFWESLDAVHGFAGEDVKDAVVEPEAQAALIGYDDTVTHFDVRTFGL
ncbi:MAG TPA: antibiotic biosynthesis monooxygenase [Actinocrinis sp.]|jgi:heme-degrading monooxygenase HmoA